MVIVVAPPLNCHFPERRMRRTECDKIIISFHNIELIFCSRRRGVSVTLRVLRLRPFPCPLIIMHKAKEDEEVMRYGIYLFDEAEREREI